MVNDGSFAQIQFVPSASKPNFQEAVFIDKKTNTKIQFSVDPKNWESTFRFDEYNTQNGKKIYDSTALSPMDRAKAKMASVRTIGNDYFCGTEVNLADYEKGDFAKLNARSPQALVEKRESHFIESRVVDFFQDSQLSINASSAIVITHPEKVYDEGLTQVAYRKFFDGIKNAKSPRIGLFSEGILNPDHVSIEKNELDFIGSSGGSHEIELLKPKTIVMAGGYLDQCLCNSLASFLKQMKKSDNLTIVFPKEVVTLANYEPTQRVFLPHISPAEAKRRLKKATPLSQLEASCSSPREFELRLSKFMSKFVFGQNPPEDLNKRFLTSEKKQGSLCPYQDSAAVNTEEFTFEIQNQDPRTGKKSSMTTVGHGSKRVNIVFAPSDRVKDYLVEPENPVKATLKGKAVVLEARRQFQLDRQSKRDVQKSQGSP